MSRGILNKYKSAILWSNLAWFDIVSKYRRTFLGPFWITLSMGVSVGVLGVVYSRIFNMDLNFFVPYLSVGLIIWGFISSIIQEAPLVYPSSRHVILNMRVEIENIILRMVIRNFIVLLHNSLILVPVFIFFGAKFNFGMLFALPGLFCLFVFCLSLAVVLGVSGARFRDVSPTVSALMGMLFLLTPIIWLPSQMQLIADVNPFYYLIESVRSPLMSGGANYLALLISFIMATLGSLLAYFLLSKYRYKLVFWI